MARKFPTALHIAEELKDLMTDYDGARTGAIKQHGWPRDKLGPGMDIRAFDMTLSDGRVYRVRVSDITPEKENAR